MENGDREDQLEKHSLPGTNQAGKGPPHVKRATRNRPDGWVEPQQDQLEKHEPSWHQPGWKRACPM